MIQSGVISRFAASSYCYLSYNDQVYGIGPRGLAVYFSVAPLFCRLQPPQRFRNVSVSPVLSVLLWPLFFLPRPGFHSSSRSSPLHPPPPSLGLPPSSFLRCMGAPVCCRSSPPPLALTRLPMFASSPFRPVFRSSVLYLISYCLLLACLPSFLGFSTS